MAHAQVVNVNGGQTSVLLDTALLEAAANLTISGVGGATTAPGDLGPGSVAFPINPRDAVAPDLPTTFSYDPADFLGTFSGAIEHSGTVLFNADSIEVGNFTIGFDAGRVVGSASGFFVESNVGVEAVVFDVANPAPVPAAGSLEVAGDLLVSPELAALLIDLQLASADLTGADVGDAFVAAIVPEPASALLTLAGGVLIAFGRRSRN